MSKPKIKVLHTKWNEEMMEEALQLLLRNDHLQRYVEQHSGIAGRTVKMHFKYS